MAVKIEKSNVSINVFFIVHPSLYGKSVAVGVVCFGDRVAAGSLRCTEHKLKMCSNHSSDNRMAGLIFNNYNIETS